MYQLPAIYWNKIAKVSPPRTPQMKRLFAMGQASLDRELADQHSKLTSHGMTDTQATIYQMAAPMLMERKTISQYLEQTDDLTVQKVLPEVTGAEEAVALLSQDHPLRYEEIEPLLRELRKLED